MIKKFLLITLPLILLAGIVNVSVNKKTLNSGDELIITITATGKKIKFPNIQEIDGNTIVGTSNSTNITIINGEMKENISKSFILYPQKDLTIPSFSVIVDGKVYKTKPIHIKVIKPKQTKGDFELDINVSKNNLYLGESAILTLKFIKKANADSIQIQKPFIKNFILKEINSKKSYKNNEEILIYKFLIIPQKTGIYEVGPFIAQVGKIIKQNIDDFFGLNIANIQYKNIYSNTLKIKVNPIPNNTIYGDFNISVNAKKEVKANEINNVKFLINGCGNFYSLKDIDLNINNATVYKSKPKLNLFIKNGKLCGSFSQTFNIIADNSYKIPSVKINTFDGKIHTISTPEIFVKVKNNNILLPANTKIKEENNTKQILTPKKNINPFLISIISLIIGAIIGIIFFKLYSNYKNSEFSKIKKADEKELLNILKKYEENDKIKEIMQKIEENIYKNANNKIDKKEIIKIIKSRKGK